MDDKPAHNMSIKELQEEIGRLQSILHFKVAGDPRVCVGQAIDPAGKEAK